MASCATYILEALDIPRVALIEHVGVRVEERVNLSEVEG